MAVRAALPLRGGRSLRPAGESSQPQAYFGYNAASTIRLVKTFSPRHAPDNVPSEIDFGIIDGSYAGMQVQDVRDGSYNSQSIAFATHYGGVTTGIRMLIDKDGSIGIGTASPQYPLSVNGTIQAKEVRVETGWADYVFDRAYRLAPLRDVGDYIDANHHLPDIPSAAEVEEKGVSVGEMQSKLLAKIEELTLHAIAAEAKNRELLERIGRLEAVVVGTRAEVRAGTLK